MRLKRWSRAVTRVALNFSGTQKAGLEDGADRTREARHAAEPFAENAKTERVASIRQKMAARRKTFIDSRLSFQAPAVGDCKERRGRLSANAP